MVQEIKSLIEKIQKEGLQKAEEEARKIILQADAEAQEIIRVAKDEAEKILKQASEETDKTKEATYASLKQAGRDFLIALKEEINNLLKRIIQKEVGEALTHEELVKMIEILVKEVATKDRLNQIEVVLSKDDFAKIKDSFLGKLSQEIKNGISLKSSEYLKKGFWISFDSGKSYFDFSLEALAEYLADSVRKELKSIL